MDASPQPIEWPAPNPELVNVLIGSILAAQGQIQVEAGPAPWRMNEFDRCANWIAAGLKGGDLTLAEVRDGVLKGWFYLFGHPEGVMVTEFIFSPRVRALHVIASGGTLKAMADLTPKAEHFAWMAGANWTGATGRKGSVAPAYSGRVDPAFLAGVMQTHDDDPHLRLSLNGNPMTGRVRLDAVPMRYGGSRYYALCPHTHRRCEVLPILKGVVGCRQFHRLSYVSQHRDPLTACHRAIERFEKQLHGSRRKNRERQEARLEAAHEKLWGHVAAFDSPVLRKYRHLIAV